MAFFKRQQIENGNRARETSRAALMSVISNSVLTVSKLVVGFMTGSISVISEGVHSGNDLVAAILALFSVRKSNEPADEDHEYGHGKYEALSGAIEAALIIVAALGILYHSVTALLHGKIGSLDHGPAVFVMALSFVVNIFVSRYLYHVAKRYDSMALQADAAHLSADVWTSGGVLIGLIGIWGAGLLGYEIDWIDPLLALFVALLVLTQGWKIASDSCGQLLDKTLPAEEIEQVIVTLQEHYPLFVGYHRLRSRRSGHQRHIDMHLVVCDNMRVAEAHEVADHLEKEIADLFPEASVMIHIDPCEEEACRRSRADGTWVGCIQRPENSGQVDVDNSMSSSQAL